MKIGFFKKVCAALLFAVGAFALAGCQTSDKNVGLRILDSSYQIIEVQPVTPGAKVTKRLRLVMSIENPTIYNAVDFTISYRCYDTNDLPIPRTDNPHTSGSWENYPINMIVGHGVNGVVYSEFDTFDNLGRVEVYDGNYRYQSVWETYFAWWISMFVIVGVAVLFYSVDLFARGLTAEELKQRFTDNVASSLVVLALLLIICIIPLIFSSWVVTLIILGGYVGFLLLSGAATAARIAIANKNN